MKIRVILMLVLFAALAVSRCVGQPARRNVDDCDCRVQENDKVCKHTDQFGKTLECINKVCNDGTEPAWKTSDEPGSKDCIECRPCSPEKMQLSSHSSCEMFMCSEGPLKEGPGKDMITTYHPTTVLPDTTVLQTSHDTSEDRTAISDQHTTSVSVQTASSSWMVIIIVIVVLLFLVAPFIVLYCLHRRGCHPVSDWINLLPCCKKPNSSGQNAGSGREMTPLASTSNNND